MSRHMHCSNTTSLDNLVGAEYKARQGPLHAEARSQKGKASKAVEAECARILHG
jgi:hypothetical protein